MASTNPPQRRRIRQWPSEFVAEVFRDVLSSFFSDKDLLNVYAISSTRRSWWFVMEIRKRRYIERFRFDKFFSPDSILFALDPIEIDLHINRFVFVLCRYAFQFHCLWVMLLTFHNELRCPLFDCKTTQICFLDVDFKSRRG
jgi:hypothetical protein